MNIEELEEALHHLEKQRKFLDEVVGDLLWALRNAESVEGIRENTRALLEEYRANSDSSGVSAGSF